MEKFYLARAAAKGVLNRLAMQQRAHNFQVLAELGDRHWVLPHHAHRGVPGADAQERAAGRDLVDARDGVRGDRRQTRASNRYPRTDLDPARIGRRQRERRVAVGPDHLRVRNPGSVEAQVLGVADELPLINVRVDTDSKFHHIPGCPLRAPAQVEASA